MKRLATTKSLATLALTCTLMAGGIAHAQAPMPGAPMGAPGGPGAPIGGQIAPSAAMAPASEDVATDAPIGGTEETVSADSATALPDTGGEPYMFAIGGLLLAGASFAMRRKLTA
jgi:LPXTG-motif cell wall-anchored protein